MVSDILLIAVLLLLVLFGAAIGFALGAGLTGRRALRVQQHANWHTTVLQRVLVKVVDADDSTPHSRSDNALVPIPLLGVSRFVCFGQTQLASVRACPGIAETAGVWQSGGWVVALN
jgi:hypothetical protein